MKRARNRFVKNLRYLCLVGVITLGLISIVGSNGGGGGGGDGGGGKAEGDDTDLSHNEVLVNLGIIDNDLQDYPTDPEGNPLEGNPLGRDTGVLHPIKEIFFMGLNLADGINNHLYDDSEQNWNELHTIDPDTFATNEHKNCIGADVDGDGFEEIVIVYYAPGQKNLWCKVIDREEGNYIENDGLILSPVEEGTRMTIAKGDIDKDSKEEIVIGFDGLYYLEFNESAELIAYKRKAYSDLYDVAVGELNDDGHDEIVVTYNKDNLEIFGHSETDFFKSLYKGAIENDEASFGWAEYTNRVSVAIGDIDNDGYNEIVFHGRIDYGGFNGYRVMAMGTDPEYHPECRPSWLNFYFTTVYYPDDWDWFARTLVVLDYDGNGEFEIFAGKYLFKYEENGPDGKNAKKLREDFPFSTGGKGHYESNVPRVLAAGDVDGDKRDDIVYVNFNADAYVVGLIDCDTGACKNGYKMLWDGSSKEAGEYGVCLANMDEDSPVIKYTGEHELLFSEPIVLAVLAAPPHHSGIAQVTGGGTIYGQGEENTATTEVSTGFSFGWSVGVEIEDDIVTQSKFAFEVEDKMSFDTKWKHSETITKSVYRLSAWDQDAVIFTAVPFDVYYYEIIAVGRDYSDENIKKGDYLTISVPREPRILKLSRTAFNENNGDFPDIDDTVLNHTIGDVCSYPSELDIDGLISESGYRTDQAETVGQGGGYTILEIKVDKSNSIGSSWDREVTISAEAGSGGVVVGQSTSFSYGFSYEIENTEFTSFSGRVGDIVSFQDWESKHYDWGLAAYPHEFGNQAVTVINYWVESNLCGN